MTGQSSFQRDLSGEGENEDIVFISGTTQCMLCPAQFVFTEADCDTPGENLKRRQFLHNLFKQMSLENMCPCLKPRPHTGLHFPLCKDCSESVQALWTCQVTLDSLLKTREGLLESVRERARLGVLDEMNKATMPSEYVRPCFAVPAPPPLSIPPERQGLVQIRNAIAFGGGCNWIPTLGQWIGATFNHNVNYGRMNATAFQQQQPNAGNFRNTTTGTQTEVGRADSSAGAHDTIAGADGQMYGIIPRKSIQFEEDLNIIKCVRRIHGQRSHTFYMCRLCRFTIRNKNLRVLRGKERPYQKMRVHVQNCRGGKFQEGSPSKPSTPSTSGGHTAQSSRKPMPTLKPAPGVKNGESAGGARRDREQRIADTTGKIYKISPTGRGTNLGILTCSRRFRKGSWEETVYMCRYCKFKLATDRKTRLIGKDRPFQKMQSHIKNCKGESTECVAGTHVNIPPPETPLPVTPSDSKTVEKAN